MWVEEIINFFVIIQVGLQIYPKLQTIIILECLRFVHSESSLTWDFKVYLCFFEKAKMDEDEVLQNNYKFFLTGPARARRFL